MGLLDRLEKRSLESLGHPRDAALTEWFGGSARSISGASVTPDSALTLMAVYRAVRLLANTMASIPLAVYERKDDGSRMPATKHPLSVLLSRRPNRWQTPFGFKQMLQGHLELRGNAYAEIISDGRGRVVELIPRHPDRITPRFGTLSPEVGEQIWYDYRPLRGPSRVILWDEMLHLRGFSQDGLIGLSPITIARETIGLALSNREYAARYLANNSSPGGIVTHPGKLSKEAKQTLRQSWNEQHGGVSKTGGVAIFEEDMKWTSIGFNPKDSQFLEQRSFDNTEIARMFDLPPHKLMDLDRSTNNNIEHQGIEYVMDSILPRAVNAEETFERDLFLPADEGRFFIEYNLEGLLRGDSAARGALYTARFNIGSLSPNDIRRKENENPVEGGDEYFIPLNMMPLSQARNQTAPADSAPAADLSDVPEARRQIVLRRLALAHERIFADAFTRAIRKEAQAGRRALAAATVEGRMVPVTAWLDTFYAEHESFVARTVAPAVRTAGDAIGVALQEMIGVTTEVVTAIEGLDRALDEQARAIARVHVAQSRGDARQILRDVGESEQRSAFDALFDTWDTRRAGADASRASAAVMALVHLHCYRVAGLPHTEMVA